MNKDEKTLSRLSFQLCAVLHIINLSSPNPSPPAQGDMSVHFTSMDCDMCILLISICGKPLPDTSSYSSSYRSKRSVASMPTLMVPCGRKTSHKHQAWDLWEERQYYTLQQLRDALGTHNSTHPQSMNVTAHTKQWPSTNVF